MNRRIGTAATAAPDFWIPCVAESKKGRSQELLT